MTTPPEPVRWIDSAADAPQELTRLLRDARRDLPGEVELASMAFRLEPEFAEGARVGTPASSGRPLPLKRLLGSMIVLGIVGAALIRAGAPAATPSATSAPPASSVLSVAPPSLVSPEVTSAPAATPAPGIAAPSPSTPPRTRVIAGSKLGEPELLERARQSLTKNPGRALALTREHKARFPNGVLRQEREVIAIEALRRLGRPGEAEDRAGSFEQRYPGSAHRRSVEQGLSQ